MLTAYCRHVEGIFEKAQTQNRGGGGAHKKRTQSVSQNMAPKSIYQISSESKDMFFTIIFLRARNFGTCPQHAHSILEGRAQGKAQGLGLKSGLRA